LLAAGKEWFLHCALKGGAKQNEKPPPSENGEALSCSLKDAE
jgi:hypothetical protein